MKRTSEVNSEREVPVDWCAAKKRINGALVHITAVFGFFLSGLVINDIAKRSEK